MLLRDPTDENVVPVVEELRRRLPPASVLPQGQGEGKENLTSQNDGEAGEEDGMLHILIIFTFRTLKTLFCLTISWIRMLLFV